MYADLIKIFFPHIFKLNEPLHLHTTFKIGGPADILALPENINQIQDLINYCKANFLDYVVIGMGSNLLVSDKGYRGIVIKIGQQMKNIAIKDDKITAEAGVRLSELAKKAAKASLSGLEFAEGIPGSLGGGIFMNAGAYGGELKNIVTQVTAIDNETGEIINLSNGKIGFSYRSSVFQNKDYIIISADMQLQKSNSDEIYKKMKEYSRNRREKQPLEYPSAGSVFRRPAGHYVGPMIEQLGLKGFKIGDAQISEKHAGFIVNRGNATAQDVIELIKYIQNKVFKAYGVNLETEIKMLGEF